MSEERLFRVSHQVNFDNPQSDWHSILFLIPQGGAVTSHYYLCPECRRWRVYNPRMSTTLKHDYRGLWEYWEMRKSKVAQQKLIAETDIDRRIERMSSKGNDVKQIPFLWLEEPDTFKIVVQPESELDEMLVVSDRYNGWKLYVLNCLTSYSLPIKIVMSLKELNLLKSRLKGNFGRQIIFERIAKDGMRRQMSANENTAKEVEKKKQEEEAIRKMFPENES